MKEKVTVKDIASRMGISLSTVNKALTGKTGISEARRAEVIAVAKEMGYVVNHVAQSLSRKPMHMGIVIPSDWQQYFSPVEYGMKMEFNKLQQSNVHGNFIHIRHSEDIQAAFEKFCEEKYDVILYCPSLIPLPESLYTFGNSVPVFIVGDECKGMENACTISVDSNLSGGMAADFLSGVLGKNQHVAVLIGSKEMAIHMDKAEAFCRRAAALDLSASVYETFDDSETAARCIDKMYEEHSTLKGIYIATAMARSMVDYINCNFPNRHPYIVATDVYDGIATDMEHGFVHASIFQNQVLMGRLAVKMAYKYLVNRFSYHAVDSEFHKRVYVTPQLYLPSNVAVFTLDDGNDYTIE